MPASDTSPKIGSVTESFPRWRSAKTSASPIFRRSAEAGSSIAPGSSSRRARYIDGLRIKASSAAAGVQTLSGGNQQKVALARWLAIDPDILILDEPTQGVDVGSKSEIYDIVQEMTERGVAVVMISSELPELLAMSDRIAVMRAGTIAGIMSRGEATQARVLAMALGHSHANA